MVDRMNRWLQRISLTIRPGNVGVFALHTLLGGILLSCQTQEARPSSSDFRDDLDRTIELQHDVRRIVSLSPATTELLFAIGAGDRLVGRTQWDIVPDAALSVVSVGEGMPPNVEAVAAVRPDLVVFYASEVNRWPMQQLETLGIQSVSVAIDLLESIPRVAGVLGAATGLQERADSLAVRFRSKLDSAIANPIEIDPISVVILTWDNPPIIIGAGSFLHEMLTLAGAQNVFADIEAPSASVSVETIADRDPDVFLVTMGTEVPAYATRPEWQTLRAISEGRFAFVGGTEFQWPSMRSFDAIPRLRAGIIRAAAAKPVAPDHR